MFYFYKNIYIEKTSPPREKCRHQIEGMGGVDVTRADWVCVRERTPLREECPFHPYSIKEYSLELRVYVVF
ncbi:hypothetical protein Hanom_Chr05g00395981 [Helianthus anomalus]